MGAKTALIAYSDGDLVAALRDAVGTDADRTDAFVELIRPGLTRTLIGRETLLECTYPPEGIVYAASMPGVDIACGWQLVGEYPSELPAHLVAASAGRRLVLHAMHSVVDFLAFAVWEDCRLVRSLSLSPGSGIMENIGEPFTFEAPYWAGYRTVEPEPGWTDRPPYPLPFHPLALGEDALQALFGFVLEGMPSPEDIDADRIEVLGFRVLAPQEEAAREAARRAVAKKMVGTPRFYKSRPDGSRMEVDPLGR